MSGKKGRKVSVLCDFWKEDGVWNGTTRELAIVVFGKTFEDAQKNLQDAIVGHLETAAELGMLDELIRTHPQCAQAPPHSSAGI